MKKGQELTLLKSTDEHIRRKSDRIKNAARFIAPLLKDAFYYGLIARDIGGDPSIEDPYRRPDNTVEPKRKSRRSGGMNLTTRVARCLLCDKAIPIDYEACHRGTVSAYRICHQRCEDPTAIHHACAISSMRKTGGREFVAQCDSCTNYITVTRRVRLSSPKLTLLGICRIVLWVRWRLVVLLAFGLVYVASIYVNAWRFYWDLTSAGRNVPKPPSPFAFDYYAYWERTLPPFANVFTPAVPMLLGGISFWLVFQVLYWMCLPFWKCSKAAWNRFMYDYE